MAGGFAYEAVPGETLSTLALTWRQFRASTGGVLDVQIRIPVEIPATGGLAYWRFAVGNKEDRVMQEAEDRWRFRSLLRDRAGRVLRRLVCRSADLPILFLLVVN